MLHHTSLFFFFFIDPATTEIYTLSLHDALPIWVQESLRRQRERLLEAYLAGAIELVTFQGKDAELRQRQDDASGRSEEHTSELQSPDHIVCRLLLEKKKKEKKKHEDKYKNIKKT